MTPSPELLDCWRAFRAANETWHRAVIGSPASARAKAAFDDAKTLLAHTLDAEMMMAELMGEIPAPLVLEMAA